MISTATVIKINVELVHDDGDGVSTDSLRYTVSGGRNFYCDLIAAIETVIQSHDNGHRLDYGQDYRIGLN